MLRTTVAMMGLALALYACGDDGDVVEDDAGTGAVDSGMRADSSTPRRDAGPADECAAEQANADSTVGCNGGFASGEFAANGPFGTCTPDETQAGSCTSPNAACDAAEGDTEGLCIYLCEPSSSYVTTGACPTGFRCFRAAEEYGICFRDCDAAHPCPTGSECDDEGSCLLLGEEPEVDGGMPDGGTDDGGLDLDAGVDLPDADLPDAAVLPTK